MGYHPNACTGQETKHFRRMVEGLRERGLGWNEMARLAGIRADRGKHGGGPGGLLKDAYDRKPIKPVYEAVKRVWKQRLKLETRAAETNMARTITPQMKKKLLDFIEKHPGKTKKDILTYGVDGIGQKTWDAVVSEGMIYSVMGDLGGKHQDRVWHINETGLQFLGKEETSKSEPTETNPRMRELDRLPLLSAEKLETFPENQRAHTLAQLQEKDTWLRVREDLDEIVTRMAALVDEGSDIDSLPPSIQDLVKSELERRLTSLEEWIKKEMD